MLLLINFRRALMWGHLQGCVEQAPFELVLEHVVHNQMQPSNVLTDCWRLFCYGSNWMESTQSGFNKSHVSNSAVVDKRFVDKIGDKTEILRK